jgi:pimeloyl-ACP methyl ester carboxylesterase
LTQLLDQRQVLQVLFHPRAEPLDARIPGAVVSVAVEPGVTIGGRLHPAERESPLLLFFHGNGEIAADYADLAPLYTRMGITLLIVDYRGYGNSSGTPTATNLLTDAVALYRALDDICQTHHLAPAQRYVMGRSLGSASALEIASRFGGELAGLIVESGFANTFDLLARLGLGVSGAEERDGFGNLMKIRRIETRTLIIHGEEDFLIPVTDAEELYSHSAAKDKRLVKIPAAGHNDVMMVGMKPYFGAIQNFVRKVAA